MLVLEVAGKKYASSVVLEGEEHKHKKRFVKQTQGI